MKLRVLAFVCAWLILFAGLAPAARAEAPATPAKARYADVAVETTSLGSAAQVVRRRVRERADVVLRRGGVLPARGADDPVISVKVQELTGDEPGYVFRVEILHNGVATTETKPVECRLCTEGELVDAIEGRLEHAVADMPAADGEVPPPRVDPVPTTPHSDAPPDKPPRPAMRIAGASLVGVGLAGTITGAVLAALEPKPKTDDPLHQVNTHVPGYALLGAGLGLAVTGAVLLIVDARRRAKHRRPTTARLR